jgi:hypothetical protein
MTRNTLRSSIAVVAFLLPVVARGQTEVLDVDAFGGTFQFGVLNPIDDEYYYTIRSPGSDTTLFALSVADGTSRQFTTTGIDVGSYDIFSQGNRMLISDRATAATRQYYSIDRYGASPPIPLNPEPGVGVSARAAPTGDVVRLIVPGDPLASDPALRDRLYTRSIDGGPATEILGGIPQLREVITAQFSEDGASLMVRTGVGFGSSGTPEKLFVARTGVTGLTPVLESPASNVIYSIYGSDQAGNYFVVNRDFSGTLGDGILYSVPVANPALTKPLTVREDNTSIGHDGTLVDVAGDRVLYTSRLTEFNPIGQPSVTSLVSVPIDGSAFPASIGNLPANKVATSIYPFAGGAWDYVASRNTLFSSDPGPLYAIQRATSTVVELAGAGGIGVGQREFLSDGTGVVFTDDREVGNDLYIGRPDQTTPVELLLDVSEEDELRDVILSPDQTTAFVLLVSSDVTYLGVADRILSIPLDGSPGKTLIDLRNDPADSLVAPGPTSGPYVTENTLVYLKADPSGQAGFYLLDLSATDTTGDYNSDGVVDAADYTVWRDTLGQDGPNLAADGDGNEVVDAEDYAVWKTNFGQGGSAGAQMQPTSVPEPAAWTMVLIGLCVFFCMSSDGRAMAAGSRDEPWSIWEVFNEANETCPKTKLASIVAVGGWSQAISRAHA